MSGTVTDMHRKPLTMDHICCVLYASRTANHRNMITMHSSTLFVGLIATGRQRPRWFAPGISAAVTDMHRKPLTMDHICCVLHASRTADHRNPITMHSSTL